MAQGFPDGVCFSGEEEGKRVVGTSGHSKPDFREWRRMRSGGSQLASQGAPDRYFLASNGSWCLGNRTTHLASLWVKAG